MALTTAAAILGAGVLAGGAGVLSAKSAANASQRATDASIAAQDRALATQQANTAVVRDVGNQATNRLAERLGLNPAGMGGGTGATGTTGPDYAAYVRSYADLKADQTQDAINRGLDPNDPAVEAAYGQRHYSEDGQKEGRSLTGAAPTAADSKIDASGNYTVERPTVAAAPTYTAPTYRETTVNPLDVGLDDQKSPDYEFQLSEGNRNILANKGATGQLESGAALKALQKYGQDLAMGDYGQWRDYTTGQYNQDRAYTANRDDAYNGFNASQAMNTFNAANNTYQYGTSLAQNMYNSDRDYSTGRWDQGTSNLLSLANLGQGGTTSYNNALSSNANAATNTYFANATNQGNAALATGGAFNNALSNATNALAFSYGGGSGSSGGLQVGSYYGNPYGQSGSYYGR